MSRPLHLPFRKSSGLAFGKELSINWATRMFLNGLAALRAADFISPNLDDTRKISYSPL